MQVEAAWAAFDDTARAREPDMVLDFMAGREREAVRPDIDRLVQKLDGVREKQHVAGAWRGAVRPVAGRAQIADGAADPGFRRDGDRSRACDGIRQIRRAVRPRAHLGALDDQFGHGHGTRRIEVELSAAAQLHRGQCVERFWDPCRRNTAVEPTTCTFVPPQ